MRAVGRAASPAPDGATTAAGRPFRDALVLHLTNPRAIFGGAVLVTLALPHEGAAAMAPTFLGGRAAIAPATDGAHARAFSSRAMRRAYASAHRRIEGVAAAISRAASLGLARDALSAR